MLVSVDVELSDDIGPLSLFVFELLSHILLSIIIIIMPHYVYVNVDVLCSVKGLCKEKHVLHTASDSDESSGAGARTKLHLQSLSCKCLASLLGPVQYFSLWSVQGWCKEIHMRTTASDVRVGTWNAL